MSNPRSVVTLLSKPEMMALNPVDRNRYVRKLILELVSNNKEWSVREIAEKTDLTRNTITKHLQQLVSEQQMVSEEKTLGAFRIMSYKKAGQIKNKVEAQSKFVGNLNYVFFTIDSKEKSSICIQQREKDEFGSENVKGAIAIDFDNFENFLKELHAFGAKIIRK